MSQGIVRSIYIPEDTHNTITELAWQKRISYNEAVRQAIGLWLQQQKSEVF